MKLKMPKVPVSLQMKKGRLRYGCSHCKSTLYYGIGNPHPATHRFIERHVKLCESRQELVDTLAKVVQLG